METACKDTATDGGCDNYYVSLVSYIGSRGIPWIIKNINVSLRNQLIWGSIINIVLSYLISCTTMHAIKKFKKNRKFLS